MAKIVFSIGERKLWRLRLKIGSIIVALLLALVMLGLPFMSTEASALPTSPRAIGLGTLGGSASFGRDINDRGQVVGASFTVEEPYGNWHAFLWVPGVGMRDLNPTGSLYSMPWSINERGDIVGYYLPSGGEYSNACLWTAKGSFINLGSSCSGTFLYSTAKGINNNGMIVGYAYTLEDIMSPSYYVGHAVIWLKGPGGYQCQDIGTLPGGDMAWAWGINDRNEVVGVSATRSDASMPMEYHPFVWTSKTGMIDLDRKGLMPSDGLNLAASINDRGQVVGYRWLPDDSGAFTIQTAGFSCNDKGRNMVLAKLPEGGVDCYCRANNVWGVKVGAVLMADSGTWHAAIWKQGGRCIDLGTLSEGFDSEALGINNLGMVIGTSSGLNNYGYGYQTTIWFT